MGWLCELLHFVGGQICDAWSSRPHIDFAAPNLPAGRPTLPATPCPAQSIRGGRDCDARQIQRSRQSVAVEVGWGSTLRRGTSPTPMTACSCRCVVRSMPPTQGGCKLVACPVGVVGFARPWRPQAPCTGWRIPNGCRSVHPLTPHPTTPHPPMVTPRPTCVHQGRSHNALQTRNGLLV